MRLADARTGIEVIPRDECLRLLAADVIGRIAVVAGRLEEVTQFDASRLHRLESLGVDPWAQGERQHWMRLVATSVTGRRVGAVGGPHRAQ